MLILFCAAVAINLLWMAGAKYVYILWSGDIERLYLYEGQCRKVTNERDQLQSQVDDFARRIAEQVGQLANRKDLIDSLFKQLSDANHDINVSEVSITEKQKLCEYRQGLILSSNKQLLQMQEQQKQTKMIVKNRDDTIDQMLGEAKAREKVIWSVQQAAAMDQRKSDEETTYLEKKVEECERILKARSEASAMIVDILNGVYQ